MKKTLLIVLLVLAGVFTASAQRMEKGKSVLNVGVGFLDLGANVSYDYGLVDTWGPGLFTIGGFVGFGTWTTDWVGYSNSWDYRTFTWAFAPRATYRYAFSDQFEVYGALQLGIAVHTYSWDHPGKNPYDTETVVFGGGLVGLRYSFSKVFGVFAEVGYSTSFINGGLSISL